MNARVRAGETVRARAIPEGVPAEPRAGVSRVKALSAASTEALQRTAFVGGVPGLQLLRSPAGTRSWRLFYRLPGDRRRLSMPLGRYPHVTLSVARQRARVALDLAGVGVDPKLERRQPPLDAVDTVASAFDRYIATLAHQNRAVTIADKRSAIRRHVLPKLGPRALGDVRRGEWISILDNLSDVPGSRRSVYAYLRHFLQWAAERELVPANPLAGIRPPRPVKSRERFLSDAELRKLWVATGTAAALARLSLLTMQRRGAIAALRWADLDLVGGVWAAPAADMKSGKAHDVPLSAPALQLLSEIAPMAGPFVFGVGSDGARPYDGFSNAMPALRKAVGGNWVFHDLRRTAVTLAQRAACSIDAIKALTQHKTSGVIGVYAMHDYVHEKREVADRVAGLLMKIVTGGG